MFFAKKPSSAITPLGCAVALSKTAGNHAEAMKTLSSLINDFPTSLRVREAKILWANSALQSGQSAQIPTFLTRIKRSK